MSKDPNGKHFFTFNKNPILNSIIYYVDFLDVSIKLYATN